jgi:hypothetical protein
MKGVLLKVYNKIYNVVYLAQTFKRGLLQDKRSSVEQTYEI